MATRAALLAVLLGLTLVTPLAAEHKRSETPSIDEEADESEDESEEKHAVAAEHKRSEAPSIDEEADESEDEPEEKHAVASESKKAKHDKVRHPKTTVSTTTTITITRTLTTTTKTTTTTTTVTKTTTTTSTGSTTTTTTPTTTSTTITHTTTTTSTTTVTSTTTSTSTSTTTSSTTTTTTTRPHVYGGPLTKQAFEEWLKVWRGMYLDAAPCGTVACLVPEMDDELLPRALHGVRSKILVSEGGVASGVVTEGMGYAIMIEGFLATQGREGSLELGLGLVRSWMGMTYGPEGCGNPRGGGTWTSPLEHTPEHVVKVDRGKYGVSAVEAGKATGLGPAGLPSWKFPLDQCEGDFGCVGTATDGDEDALLGMIYLTAALDYPEDMVDMVVRTLVAFASADLGFPDLYRTLPSGERMYVPKGGSDWGGLLPEEGKFSTTQQPWCYSPSYFAPAHYRTFRDFAGQNWKPYFDQYLPPRSDGTKTTLLDLTAAFEGAITAGYNLLYHASCESGGVSNWVGVKSECPDKEALNCDGVPWADTPYVGPDGGTCSASGTEWGSYGADASRAAWRIAMDYTLYKDESDQVTIYDRDGHPDKDVYFSANVFLNRIVRQYVEHSQCSGAVPWDCFPAPGGSPWKMAAAWDFEADPPPEITCDNVPNQQATWWASYMAYPTFTAFVAPFPDIIPEDSTAWMETFSSLCDWESEERVGLCATTYFEASQSIISTMIMAKVLMPMPLPPDPSLEEPVVGLSPEAEAGMEQNADVAVELGIDKTSPLAKRRAASSKQRSMLDTTRLEQIVHERMIDYGFIQQKSDRLHGPRFLTAQHPAGAFVAMCALFACALLVSRLRSGAWRLPGLVFLGSDRELSEDGEHLLAASPTAKSGM